MNLQESVNRIKEVISLIVEQSNITVSIVGEQPYPNGTDWDSVHGILGSKKIDDDLEDRVGKKLKEGNYKVTDVKVSSYVKNNKVITEASAILTLDNDNPDVAFTTRGSIGDNFIQRHDNQVNGLVGRLSDYYKGTARQFGPFIVEVKGTPWKYKQSFFAISKNNKTAKTVGEPTLEQFKSWVVSDWGDEYKGDETFDRDGEYYTINDGKQIFYYIHNGKTFVHKN
jgi:hypothetical protein